MIGPVSNCAVLVDPPSLDGGWVGAVKGVEVGGASVVLSTPGVSMVERGLAIAIAVFEDPGRRGLTLGEILGGKDGGVTMGEPD